MNVSCLESHHNPAAVILGCPLTGDSSDGKATQGDENLFSTGLDSHEVVNASETLPRLPLAESTGLVTSFKLVGYYHEF